MAKYPTKEKILEKEMGIEVEVLDYVRSWRKTTWKEARDTGFLLPKQKALALLVTEIALLLKKPVNVEINNKAPVCMYQKSTMTITLDTSASVISALHELGHHLFSLKELLPCRWSNQIFKEVFPKAEEKLLWQGHMRIRKPNCRANCGRHTKVVGNVAEKFCTNCKTT